MKRIFLLLLTTSLTGLLIYCGSNESGLIGPEPNNGKILKTGSLKKHAEQLKAVGLKMDEIDIFLSLNWFNFDLESQYDFISDGAAFAFNNDPNQLLSLDMGDVILNTPQESFKFFKLNEGSEAIYSLQKAYYDSTQTPLDQLVRVPFKAFSSYAFNITGSSKVNGFNVAFKTPSAKYEITSHKRIDSHDFSEDLTITWEKGNNEDNVILLAWADKYEFSMEDIGKFAVFSEKVDAATGTYTISKEELKKITGGSTKFKLHIDLSCVNLEVIKKGNTNIAVGSTIGSYIALSAK